MNAPLSLLVLGGARSGKSRYAQARAEALDGELVFIATAQAYDEEMTERIVRHRLERGVRWRTVEAPIDLVDALDAEAQPGNVLLVDCLTLWASNLMLAERDYLADVDRLIAALRAARAPVILVTNEVGLGIVPDNPLARAFRDVAGTTNQMVAAAVDEAYFLVAGLPMRLK
jgi:adenosylcobinamide kinase/adenosylcobinamide-phosphate guanylyltransferase